jgi:chaperonin cofactor prefoldin
MNFIQQTTTLYLPQQPTTQQLNTYANKLTAALATAAEASMPRLKVIERSKPWWNEELKQLQKQLHTALWLYKKTRSEESCIG